MCEFEQCSMSLEGSQHCMPAWVCVQFHYGVPQSCKRLLDEREPTLNFWLSLLHRVQVYLNLNQASKLHAKLIETQFDLFPLVWLSRHYVHNQLKPLLSKGMGALTKTLHCLWHGVSCMKLGENVSCTTLDILNHTHTSRTALRECVCVCLSVCLRPYTVNFK